LDAKQENKKETKRKEAQQIRAKKQCETVMNRNRKIKWGHLEGVLSKTPTEFKLLVELS
jgi:hypothetical protein